MKKLVRMWKRLTFARQLTLVFLGVFLFQLIIVQGISSSYMKQFMKERIEESYQNALKQTMLNLEASLSGYKNAIDELFRNTDFVLAVNALNNMDSENEWKVKSNLDNYMKDFMTYRSEVRSMTIRIESGLQYGYDRQELELLNPKISMLHQNYFDSGIFEDSQGLKGKWVSTAYLDRKGTREYYVFSYGKQVVEWYANRQVGIGIVSIEESVLSDICENAQLNDDKNANYIMIVDGEGKIISHYNKKMLGKSIQDYFQEKGLNEPDTHNMILRETVSSTGWEMISVLDEDYIYHRLYEIQRIVLLFSVALAVIVLFLVLYVSKKMSKYISDIVVAMNKVQGGKLNAKVGIRQGEKNEISLIASHFNIMMETVNDQMETIRDSGQREKEAELRALEAQINPHFIYNTLDSINWLAIENDQKEISNMLGKFAQMLRYQIQKSNKIVSIEEELVYLEQYLYLQKVRFMDSFEYVIECQQTVKGCLIHKMIFQPFIENAVLHGVTYVDRGGLIKIQIGEQDEKHLYFTVSDNGQGMTEEQRRLIFIERKNQGNSIGVLNVLARLDLYYGMDYEVKAESEPGGGTAIRTIIPKRCSEELREEENENTDSGG